MFLSTSFLLIGALHTTAQAFILPDQLHHRHHGRSLLPGKRQAYFSLPHPPVRTLKRQSAPSALSLFPPVSQVQSILHHDPYYCFAALLLLSKFGITLEERTIIGKALSAPLATMALSLTAANIGLLPFSSPVYAVISQYFVPLAVPMLLFDSDLRRVIRDTGSLLLAFIVGAVATVVGTFAAFAVLPMKSLGQDSWKVACALAARHIGGAINFVAVADTVNMSGTAVSAAIAADNIVVALYFAMLFTLATQGEERKGASENKSTDNSDVSQGLEAEKNAPISLQSLASALSASASLLVVGRWLTKCVLPAGTSSLPMISFLTVLSATYFPKRFTAWRPSGTALGILFIQLFFAASGAAGSIKAVMRQAPALFAFSALQIGVHFVFLMVTGRALKLADNDLYLASNANVGGPTTAAAMAQAKQWHRAVLPALLIGIFGYATATAIALAMGPLLIRMAR